MIPIVLAIPEVQAAAVALMGMYVRWGPQVINAVCEIQMPVGPGQVVAGAIVRQQVKTQITDNVVREAMNTHKCLSLVKFRDVREWAAEHPAVFTNRAALNDMLRTVHALKCESALRLYIKDAQRLYGTKTLADFGPLL